MPQIRVSDVLRNAVTLRRGVGVMALGLAAALCAPGPVAVAQDVGVVQSEVLVIDIERFFQGSLLGQRMIEEYQTARDELIAHNREIEAELRAEEQALTERRAKMTPSAFRDLADGFDAKVRSIRQENELAARDLEGSRERAPLTLMRMAEPVLVELMRDAGGTIILDQRQVLLRAEVVDITDLAIARVNATIGDGAPPETPAPDQPTPDQPAPDQPEPEPAEPEPSEP